MREQLLNFLLTLRLQPLTKCVHHAFGLVQ